MKPFRCLDLFCGAGGAGMGYSRSGFEVVGVDLHPQKHYPFEFVQGDALEYCYEHGHEFDFIHASPPCQRYSTMRRGRWQDREHPGLIAPTQTALRTTGKPYIIENVEGARRLLVNPVMLCGTMFGLGTKEGNQLRRHRYFECSFGVVLTPPCRHNRQSAIGVYGGGQHPARRKREGPIDLATPEDAEFGIRARRSVMGIEWMSGKELNQAIPPAYTEFLGRQAMAVMERDTA